jgi:tyrosine-protein kinase Etk/Wzc
MKLPQRQSFSTSSARRADVPHIEPTLSADAAAADASPQGDMPAAAQPTAWMAVPVSTPTVAAGAGFGAMAMQPMVFMPAGAVMAAPPAPPAGPSPLLTVADNLLQHKRLFLALLLGALVLGLLYLLASPPVFRADTLLQMQPKSNRPLTASLSQQGPAAELPQGFVQGELEILRSREIVAQAITNTQADLDIAVANRLPVIGDWFARSTARGTAPGAAPLGLPWLAGFAWGGETLRVGRLDVPPRYHGVPFTLLVQEGTAPAAGAPAPQWTLADRDGVPVAQGGVGQPVHFTLDGQPALLHVAELAAAPGTQFRVLAQDPAAVYEQMLRNLQVVEAGRDSGVVRVSLTDANPRFAASFLDALTAAYLEHDQRVRTAEATRSLRFLEGQLPAVKRELDRAEEALDRYRTGSNTVNLGQETESSLRRIGELERQRVEVQMRRDQFVQRFTYQHPDAIAMQRQLATIASELVGLRNRLRQAPRQEKDVVRLQRDVQVNTQLYTALLNNAQELRVAQAGMGGGARLIDPAGVAPLPVRPQPGAVMSVAGGLGLVVALAGVALACVLRPTVRTADDLESQTGLNTQAAIPESPRQRALMRGHHWFGRTRPRLLATDAPADPAVESLRGLRTGLALRHPDQRCNTVLITAATANVGKSFIAANLGALAAAAGGRVLLMDLDLRVPSLHAYLGLERGVDGLTDVLAERCTLDDAIVREVLPGLDVLLPGRRSSHPGELLLSPRFEALQTKLEALYDSIIIDSAPVLPVGDTLTVARWAATTLLVARSESSSVREVRDALRRLESAGVGVDGLILNGVKRGRLAAVPYSAYYQ